MKRRQFIQAGVGAGVAFSTAVVPLSSLAQSAQSFDVVVVGGGMAGATVAKYLRLWSRNSLSVLLIERDAVYTSNIMSNEVLTGKRASVSSLNYKYDTLVSKYQITRVQAEVNGIDTGAKMVSTADGKTFYYSRLVLAPGLEFDLMPGMSSYDQYATTIPHAWKAGPQTTLLRQQLLGLQDGQNVVITIPPSPYRCPPGPYERACVVADWLKTNKPNSKLIVLDANSDIQAQATNFHNAFGDKTASKIGLYGYSVDYRASCSVESLVINPGAHIVKFTQNGIAQQLTANVLNPIPPQRAPKLLAEAGLSGGTDGKFAPVNVLTYESTLKAGVHVIGDASISGMPKAGHIGNQEAKTCANAIVNALKGGTYALAEGSPVLNSACFTPVNATMATWLSAVYQYQPPTAPATLGKMVSSTANGVTGPLAAKFASTANYGDMEKWFSVLMSDTFA